MKVNTEFNYVIKDNFEILGYDTDGHIAIVWCGNYDAHSDYAYLNQEELKELINFLQKQVL